MGVDCELDFTPDPAPVPDPCPDPDPDPDPAPDPDPEPDPDPDPDPDPGTIPRPRSGVGPVQPFNFKAESFFIGSIFGDGVCATARKLSI